MVSVFVQILLRGFTNISVLGEKEFDPESYIWDDMDEKWEVHNSLINNPRYEDWFLWTCCEKKEVRWAAI